MWNAKNGRYCNMLTCILLNTVVFCRRYVPFRPFRFTRFIRFPIYFGLPFACVRTGCTCIQWPDTHSARTHAHTNIRRYILSRVDDDERREAATQSNSRFRSLLSTFIAYSSWNSIERWNGWNVRQVNASLRTDTLRSDTAASNTFSL